MPDVPMRWNIRAPDGDAIYRSIEDQLPSEEAKAAYRKAITAAARAWAEALDAELAEEMVMHGETDSSGTEEDRAQELRTTGSSVPDRG